MRDGGGSGCQKLVRSGKHDKFHSFHKGINDNNFTVVLAVFAPYANERGAYLDNYIRDNA